MNTRTSKNRFDDFFKEQNYVTLKNDLYNYRLRRSAVTRYLNTQNPRVILETGSGISPVSSHYDRTVFTDLSFQALSVLKHINADGEYVVADCCNLPFRSSVFSHVISSEVLEHIPDDRPALMEMARVVKQSGQLIITFPHRRCYYSLDDRYVGHFRRYEIEEMEIRLESNGFHIKKIEKILGPLEKLAMITAVSFYAMLRKRIGKRNAEASFFLKHMFPKIFQLANTLFMAPVWIEAKILPASFATVLMIIGSRKNR